MNRFVAPAVLALCLAGKAAAADDGREQRMIALYDELCLQTFPDDAKVDAFMAARGARALTPDEVRVTFNDDPGRGWLLDDEGAAIQIMLELPPYHACSVRWMTDDGFADTEAYEAISDGFVVGRPGFVAQPPIDANVHEFAVHALVMQRDFADGGFEALMQVEQRVADPARRANGENRVSVRLVHQIVSPDAR